MSAQPNTQQPTKANWFKRHKILTGIMTFVVLLTIIGATTPQKSMPSSNTNSATATTSATTSTQTTAEKVAAWHQKYYSDFTTLANDLEAYYNDGQKLGSTDDYSAVQSDCQKMQSDATANMNLPAVPDPSAATHLSSALTYIQQSAQECSTSITDYYAGNTDQAIAVQETSNTEMTNADTQLQAAFTIINKDAN